MRKLLLSIILSITVVLQIFAAGTFTVTNTNDNGAGSLRVAMQNAIVSGSGAVSIQTSGTITLASALPVITAPITIACTNTSGITISGNNAYRVFEVQLATGTVTFKNLNIINGVGTGGGGIFAITSNNGKVTLENCTISGCNATGSQAYGGAICSSADVDLVNCTLTGNSAADGGGAIEMIDGTGVSTLTINHSTITQNATATNDIAGGVDVYLNKIIISNSIVGNNTNGDASSSRDISLDVSNINTQVSSYNLYTTAPFTIPGAGDLINKSVTELGLSALANNGGSVKTLALTPLSLARNSATGVLATDARGITRDSKSDRGAYEAQAAFDIALSASAINENVATNSVVGTLSSMDNDTGDIFTYSLVSGTDDTDDVSFNISGANLRITNSPDYETKSSYTVRVRTTDQDGFTYEKPFTITINNLNEAPIDIALSASSINENVAANSIVGTLNTTDPDAGNTFTYTLVSGTGSNDNASFNISGSNLRITDSPDYEAKSSYTVRVRTTDQGSLSYEKVFMIIVNNVNETSSIITQVVSSIAATSAIGNGDITYLGAPNPTGYGVCWNTTGAPTISDSKVDNGAVSVTGAFTAAMTGLIANTTYYVRAFATNSAGTSYGAEVSFTTNYASQVITFNSLPTKTYGDVAYSLTATSDAGLTISYASDNTAVATVSGNTVTIVGAGTANITASQAGNATYSAATNATQQLTINKKALSVTAVSDTKTYNGTTVSTAVPTVGALAIGDAVNIPPIQVFDNATVGTTHVLTASGLMIKKGSTDVTGNYDINYVSTNNGIVSAKPLTISSPTVTLSKLYDGTNVASVIAGTLSGVLPNDLNNVTVTVTANYDNAIVGTNKTITVVYALGGSAAGNYTAPIDFVVTGAKIVDITSGINEPKASDSEGVTAYPSQVLAGQACTIKVTGMADSDLQGAVLYVYTMQGICVYHSTKVELLNSIYLPSIEGIYLGRVTTTKGKEFQFKVIVTK